MAGNKYLYDNAGVATELAANQTSAGAGDAGKIVALDANGRLDLTLMPTGVGPDTAAIQASENLAAGDFINIYDAGGSTFRCRKADAATAKVAHGFVLAGVTSGANADVYFEGNNNQVTGVTPGPLFLSDSVPGGFQTSEPTGSGYASQIIGIGTSSTNINVEFRPHIIKA